MRKTPILITAALAASMLLGACEKRTLVAERDTGVCYSLGQTAAGEYRYNKIKEGLTQIEQCAGALETMRRDYLRVGGNVRETLGAFQGKFVFVMQDGIYWGDSLEGSRYLGLVRTNDDRLVMPGAVVEQQ